MKDIRQDAQLMPLFRQVRSEEGKVVPMDKPFQPFSGTHQHATGHRKVELQQLETTQSQLNCNSDTSALYTTIFHGYHIPPGSPGRGMSRQVAETEETVTCNLWSNIYALHCTS